jgi:hypothetical protein
MLKYFCDRCKKEIKENDPIWQINQIGQYGSIFDNERIHISFCDDCLSEFMGSDGEQDE